MQIQIDISTLRNSIVQSLSLDFAVPFKEVETLYGQEWDRLSSNARLTEFLPLLAGRGVKDILRVRRRAREARVAVSVTPTDKPSAD